MDTMAAIRQTFFQECEEQLAELETGLLAIAEGDADAETVNAVFRAVHSVKGGAGAFKLADLVGFAHVFETALDAVRSGRLVPTPDVVKVMLRAADMLADLVRAARDGGTVEERLWRVIASELEALESGEGLEGPAAELEDDLASFDFQPLQVCMFEPEPATEAAEDARNTFSIRFRPRPELYVKANDPVLILRELQRLGELSVRCDATTLPLLDALDPTGAYLEWSITLVTEQDLGAVRDTFEFVEADCDLEIVEEGQGAPPAEPSAETVAELIRLAKAEVAEAQQARVASSGQAAEKLAEDAAPVAQASQLRDLGTPAGEAAKGGSGTQATIRVDLDRVDRLVNLAGELVINQAMLAQRTAEAGLASAPAVSAGLDELGRLTREIQESVMAIRAQPVKPLFQRMSRIVREVAEATGKSVRLKTDGEATEVDKTVIEKLADPLTHMIRNAVDHGLEGAEARAAAGKSTEGVIRLSATHRSGRIAIEVADDGGGINRPRVREAAINKGLIPPDAQLSESEVDNLIFLPGFSTSSTVSNISGRGVGMDVVRRSVQAIGGRISIVSRPGQGTTFTLSLPLTLAVLDGMVIAVAGQTMVVPLTAIVETLKPRAEDVHRIGPDDHVLAVRDSFVPLVDIGRRLGYRSAPLEPLSGVVILVETESHVRCALLVDGIQDQRQVVIKSLEANYGRVEGVAAATILGDGRVALILDVSGVIARSPAMAESFETNLLSAAS